MVKKAFEHLRMHENPPVHVSFDIDSMDPLFAPGTGTLVRGGATYRESQYFIRKTVETGNLVGFDMVEINPDIEVDKEVRKLYHGDFPDIKGT